MCIAQKSEEQYKNLGMVKSTIFQYGTFTNRGADFKAIHFTFVIHIDTPKLFFRSVSLGPKFN